MYEMPTQLIRKNRSTNTFRPRERERCLSSMHSETKVKKRCLDPLTHCDESTLSTWFLKVRPKSSYGPITYLCFASSEILDKMSHTAYTILILLSTFARGCTDANSPLYHCYVLSKAQHTSAISLPMFLESAVTNQ